jgi:hypothetical protein
VAGYGGPDGERWSVLFTGEGGARALIVMARAGADGHNPARSAGGWDLYYVGEPPPGLIDALAARLAGS